MMGRGGSSSTIGAMHLASGLLAYGVVRAMQDGIERGRQLRAVDQAHAVGQAYYVKRVRQRRAEALELAAASKTRLLANRKMLHG
jgi:hypothetical protein